MTGPESYILLGVLPSTLSILLIVSVLKVFETKFKSSSKSKGLGKYSNAPFFSALTAVKSVDLADITIILRLGFIV